MSMEPSQSTGLPLAELTEKTSPEDRKRIALVRELTEATGILVVRVASCKCDKRDSCKLYLQGKRMADIMDQIQDIKEGVSIGRATTGPEGRGKGGKRGRHARV